MRNAIMVLSILCCLTALQAQTPDPQSTVSAAPYRPPDHLYVGPGSTGIPHHAEILGQMAPDVTLAGTNDAEFALRSYRGKPLLIDLWATRCAPCRSSLLWLNRIHAEVKDKGLTVISFDQDREPETAVKFMARHRYAWMNYHDGDRRVENALQGDGIPLTVLIDAQGKIVYYDFSNHEAALRKAIAALGPEFASVAPSQDANSESAPDDDSKPDL